jgi:hypothetical protein
VAALVLSESQHPLLAVRAEQELPAVSLAQVSQGLAVAVVLINQVAVRPLVRVALAVVALVEQVRMLPGLGWPTLAAEAADLILEQQTVAVQE